MRPIDAVAFVLKGRRLYEQAGWELNEVHYSQMDVELNIATMPTIQLVQHGLWYRTPELTDIGEYIDRDTWKCTVCGSEWAFIEGTPEDNGFKYCPECGAKMKMDGEEHEAN